jgi:hypothetical protein
VIDGVMALVRWAAAKAEADLSSARAEAYLRGCSLVEAALQGALQLAGASPNAQAEATRELATVAVLLAERVLTEPQGAPAAEAA